MPQNPKQRAPAPAPAQRAQAVDGSAWPAASADIESDLGPDQTVAEFRRTVAAERRLIEREIRKRMDRIGGSAPADLDEPA